MQIAIFLRVAPDRADPNDESGLTSQGYDDLIETLMEGGWEIAQGPARVEERGENN